MNRSKGKEKWIHGYKSSQKILLVGEGDFSFSACLARAFHTAENIVATTYLKRKSLLKKHSTSIPHLEELENLGCLLLYKVDVHKMHTHQILKNKKFDIIIFNFPHAGHYDHLCERDKELIEMHMNLVEAYFKNASKMLTEGGEVHLRHREDHPYGSWNFFKLAGKSGLIIKEKVEFNKSDYPGYHNKRGGGIKTNKTFPIICASTFKFSPYLPNVVTHCHSDLFKIDEVHVKEMNNQVHGDQIQVSCGKDIDHVNVSYGQHHLKINQVDERFQNDEVDDLLTQKDEANDDLFSEVHVLKNCRDDVDKVDDILLKKDDQLHDLVLLKVIDAGALLGKDEVNADLGDVDDYQVNIKIQNLYVVENKPDLYQQHKKTDEDDEVHESLMKDQDHDQQRLNNDHDLDVYVKETKGEMEKLHGDLYARVVEMMDQLQEMKFLVSTSYA